MNKSFIDFPLSFIVSLVWVSSYGYKYNVAFLNSPFVNWFSFTLWTAGLFSTIRIYRFFAERISRQSVVIIIMGLVYFVSLWIIEFVGYYMMKIRLTTSYDPLLFGVIHGPTVLKCYYVLAGPGIIFLIVCLDKVYEIYIRVKNRPV